MSKVKTLKAETTTKKDSVKIKNRDLLTISIQEEVMAVNVKHKELTDELATKDEFGNAVRTENNQIDFGDNIDKATESWNNTLDEDVEVVLYPIQLSDLEDLNLDANIMKPLLGLIVVE